MPHFRDDPIYGVLPFSHWQEIVQNNTPFHHRRREKMVCFTYFSSFPTKYSHGSRISWYCFSYIGYIACLVMTKFMKVFQISVFWVCCTTTSIATSSTVALTWAKDPYWTSQHHKKLRKSFSKNQQRGFHEVTYQG